MSGFTHLFNAMSPLTSREPGVVGAALEDASAWCGIIVDGVHVDPVVLKLALRLRPHERFNLITDAMPCVGAAETSFQLQGKTITVRDGACFDDEGTLAGSALDMAGAVRNAVRMLGVDLADASRMSRATNLRAGVPRSRPRAGLALSARGYFADLVLLDDDLRVLDTWIHGHVRAPRPMHRSARRCLGSSPSSPCCWRCWPAWLARLTPRPSTSRPDRWLRRSAWERQLG